MRVFLTAAIAVLVFALLLTGVKRDAQKAISSFDIKIDEKAYSYPKDSCKK